MNKFQQDLRTGSIGEDVIFNFLKSNANTKSVIDVRYDTLFQELDVDFIQETHDNQIRKIEVKTDTNKISNCLYSVAMFNDKKVVFRAEISSKSIRIDGVGSYVMPEDKGEELAEYIDGLVKKYNVD